MSNLIKNNQIDGWLRTGLTSIDGKKITITGFLKNIRVSANVLLQDIERKIKERFFSSTVEGIKDRARGFYRDSISSTITAGGSFAKMKLTSVFNLIFGRVFQYGVSRAKEDNEYGRRYLQETDIKITTDGTLEKLTTDDTAVVYYIETTLLNEVLYWQDITDVSVYQKTE